MDIDKDKSTRRRAKPAQHFLLDPRVYFIHFAEVVDCVNFNLKSLERQLRPDASLYGVVRAMSPPSASSSEEVASPRVGQEHRGLPRRARVHPPDAGGDAQREAQGARAFAEGPPRAPASSPFDDGSQGRSPYGILVGRDSSLADCSAEDASRTSAQDGQESAAAHLGSREQAAPPLDDVDPSGRASPGAYVCAMPAPGARVRLRRSRRPASDCLSSIVPGARCRHAAPQYRVAHRAHG